jgi:hypothetical protein
MCCVPRLQYALRHWGSITVTVLVCAMGDPRHSVARTTAVRRLNLLPVTAGTLNARTTECHGFALLPRNGRYSERADDCCPDELF